MEWNKPSDGGGAEVKSILLANSDMTYRGGTQAWIRQLAQTLGQCHKVDVFTLGAQPTDLSLFTPGRAYDIALINHWTTMQALRHANIGTRIVTVHGVLPFEEIPVLGADAYVSVSEAVQEHIPLPSTVIRNPIDTNYFAPRVLPAASPEPLRVAFVSNRQGEALPILREACVIAGMELRVVGKENGVADPREIYLWADIVVGIARVAMEALTCGRNVLCFDYQGYHGMATRERLPELYRSNFGGHIPGRWPTPAEVARALVHDYDPSRSLRADIVQGHSPETVAQAYLDLAQKVGRRRVATLVRRGPQQLMSPKVTQALSIARRLSRV